jgi:transposase
MDARQERGFQIATTAKIEKNPLGWKVPSQSGNGSYVVKINGEPYCTCPDFEARHQPCKHIYAVQYMLQKQEWTAYNEAQTHEAEHFAELLRGLCDGIPQTPYKGKGRPSLPLCDVVFAAVSKVYGTMSGRRSMTDLREAQDDGFMVKTPHYNTMFCYLEKPELTPILKELIEESSKPLKTVEVDFAVDSSGFATSTYARWFDHKWGKERLRQTWVKTHIMVGVKTQVITSVEATPTESSDSAQFAGLVERTARTFMIDEVSADKAYSSRKNLHAVEKVGGVAYIPFVKTATGLTNTKNPQFDPLWNRMHAFYMFNRESFLEHYHKRSLSETAFSMIKAKFGGHVRSKTPVAQVNEALCKVLCHNICVLIQSIYELGIAPTFWAKEAVAQKLA